MSDANAELWPWIVIAGLGFYHGINPAMGWLFAVALGVHRKSGRIVLLSLAPIALGHAASVAAVLAALLMLGLVVDRVMFARLAAGVLIGWATWHALYGHRRRPLVGMQTGLLGLLLWSFVTATAHGAGLMLVPALLPLCGSTLPASQLTTGAAIPLALAALGVHTGAMLAAIGIVSIAVYRFVDLGFLRYWINFDLVWIVTLAACGVMLLV